MKNISRHIGKLQKMESMQKSAKGNPRYRAFVGDGKTGFSFVTKPDCLLAYKVNNLCGSQVEITIGKYYGRATLNSIKVM